MSKDEVLELVGSPNRTERFEGKEKWAYRFYTGSDKNIENLRQVTFYNGKVVSSGDDVDEINRLNQLKEEDAKRAERKKNFKLPPEPNLIFTPSGVVEPRETKKEEPPQTEEPPKRKDFVEMKGRRGPVKTSDSEEE